MTAPSTRALSPMADSVTRAWLAPGLSADAGVIDLILSDDLISRLNPSDCQQMGNRNDIRATESL